MLLNISNNKIQLNSAFSIFQYFCKLLYFYLMFLLSFYHLDEASRDIWYYYFGTEYSGESISGENPKFPTNVDELYLKQCQFHDYKKSAINIDSLRLDKFLHSECIFFNCTQRKIPILIKVRFMSKISNRSFNIDFVLFHVHHFRFRKFQHLLLKILIF